MITDLIIVLLGLLMATKLRAVIPIGVGGALDDTQVAVPSLVYLRR